MSFTFDARVDARAFNIEMTMSPGETVAVLGPNGAGKSTLLNLVSGLLIPDAGHAILNGEVLFDVGSTKKPLVRPPSKRGVSMLAQEALLFPHMSALDNVAFGPRSAGASKAAAHATARHWLAEVDASALEHRKPAQLSGGQAQRIAVARALASDPQLLLLDEPMAALDVSVAPALRRLLRRVLKTRTAIIVTHDPLDAFTLADRVLVLSDGIIVEQGPTREVLERPRTEFAAHLTGLNVITGTRTTTGLRTSSGTEITLATKEHPAMLQHVAAAVRPAAVTISRTETPHRRDNTISGNIQDLEPRGDLVRVRSAHITADIPLALAADLDLVTGDTVWFSFHSSDTTIYTI